MLQGLKNLIQPKSVTKFAGVPGGVSFAWGNSFGWMGWNKTAQLQRGYSNKIVYAYANVLVTKLVEVPQTLYLVKDEQMARKAERFNFGNDNNRTGRYNFLEVKALDEVKKHPLIELLETPNGYQSGMQMRTAFWFNAVISGDGYIWAERLTEGKSAGEPIHLHCLPSQLVQPVRISNDYNAPISYYLFTTWSGLQIKIMPEDMIHYAAWSPFDPVLGGYSPLVPGAKTIATNEANQEAQGKAFVNGSTGIIIHSDVGGKDGDAAYDKLTEQQVSSIKQTLAREYQGASNNQMTHVTNGYVDVKKLGDTLADLQLCEAEKANWRDGGALFNVSPILVGDMSGGTDNNVQVLTKALVINNAIPKLRMLDSLVAQKVKLWYPSEKLKLIHDIKQFTELSPDLKLMSEVYGKSNCVSMNELRKLLQLDEDPAYANITLIDGSKKTLEQIQDGNFDAVPTDPTKRLDYR